MRPPRVAFFTDSFHEINGVAHTSRNFVSYAQRHNLPFLSVRAGNAQPTTTGELHTLELPRSRASIAMEKDLHFDPLFPRHLRRIDEALRAFQPDILHLTGPSELGIFAAWFAWRHRIPLAASWHTNVHEYAGRRMHWLTRFLPRRAALAVEQLVERLTLSATTRFYRLARVLFAPNPELCNLLEHRCHRPVHLMQRGVDTTLFSPTHRTRPQAALSSQPTPPTPPSQTTNNEQRTTNHDQRTTNHDQRTTNNESRTTNNEQRTPTLTHLRQLPPDTLVLGFVGRLSIEKNVALLPTIQAGLRAQGIGNTRFLIVGHGTLEPDLRRALPDALFPGVLRGHDLAEAYANMDLLVFPSPTDTFGNVVLEALASGVPALVTPSGGPRHIIHDPAHSTHPQPINQTGYILNDTEFVPTLVHLAQHPELIRTMAQAARAHALTCSWDAVFDKVYTAYRPALQQRPATAHAGQWPALP